MSGDMHLFRSRLLVSTQVRKYYAYICKSKYLWLLFSFFTDILKISCVMVYTL